MEKFKTNNNLPNLICPGAQRSGTSYLHKLLSQHPKIFGAIAKEVHYFDQCIDRGPQWYSSHFKNSGHYIYRLDTTPEYMVFEEIPGDIRETLGPDVKFIFMLRNPVDRIYSDYNSVPVHRKDSTFKDSFQMSLEFGIDTTVHRGENISYAVKRGFYSQRIKAFMEIFPPENMFFVIFEDFIKDPKAIIMDICRFLDIEYCDSIDYAINKNPSLKTERKFLYKMDHKLISIYRFISSLITIEQKEGLKKLRNRVKGMKPRIIPELDPELAKTIMNIYRSDIIELEKMTSHDLSCWIDKYS